MKFNKDNFLADVKAYLEGLFAKIKDMLGEIFGLAFDEIVNDAMDKTTTEVKA